MSGVPMDLVGVRIELPSNQPIVLLRERDGSRYLPIWIGPVEATAIAYALEDVEHQRPLTHDLLRLVIEELGAAVSRVVVTELRDNVFYADLIFEHAGEERRISARPSDAIALATRTGTPLFASLDVLSDAGIELEEDSGTGEEEQIERFREFLEDATVEDFLEEPPTS